MLAEVIGRFHGILRYQELSREARWEVWCQMCNVHAARLGHRTTITVDSATESKLKQLLSECRTGVRGIQDLFRRVVLPLLADESVGSEIQLNYDEQSQTLSRIQSKI
jgi:ATP-dependent Clp protease ATP-binding subunit ClpA